MLSIQEAADTLRTALRKKGVESDVQDAFDSLASCLILLNSSSPSAQMIRKLCTVLRQPFLPLYKACLRPALQLASSILSTVLGKLCDAQSTDQSLCTAWDATAVVVMSGILDFLDQKDGSNAESGDAVWEVLYRIICEFFFLDFGRGLPAFSIPLCLSAYNTLTEAASKQITIRNALRQRAVLGGERLGIAISGTKDYLLLEALLVLFARLLPPIDNTSRGKIRRLKFVKEVLGSPKLFKCSTELLSIMQKTSGIHWDDVAAQIIDALAKSDITYPQPFDIDEIHVCGRVFPQPLATDRLIADNQAFLANIIVEDDDICESLQIPYSRIHKIALDNSEENVSRGKVLIMVHLASPPLIANVEMKLSDASHLHAKFLLQNTAVGKFMEALRRRGVGKLSFLSPLTRVNRKRKSVSIGSGFKFTNDSSPIPPTASFEGKVQHVNEVYRTNIEDPTSFQVVPVSRVVDAGSLHTVDLGLPFDGGNLTPEDLGSAVPEGVLTTHKSTELVPPTNQGAKLVQKRVFPCLPWKSAGVTPLFDDSDELSEISEFEADNNTRFERVASGPSISNNCESKLIQLPFEYTQAENTTWRSNQSSESALKPTDDRGTVQRSSETVKPFLTSDSPTFVVASSTQVAVFPKPLPNSDTLLLTVDVDVVDCRSVASQDSVGADALKRTGFHEREPPESVLFAASAGKLPAKSYVKDEQHITQSSGAKQDEFPCIMTEECTSTPLKIAGSRRKRESTKSSSKPINKEIDDEYTPPRKKTRGDRAEVEDKVKSNETPPVISLSKIKRYTKTARRSSPSIDLTTVNPGLKSTCEGTRRSSRIKKRQAAIACEPRPNATRNMTQREKLVCIESTHRTQPIHDSQTITLSPFQKIDDQVSCVELGGAEYATTETRLTEGISEGNSTTIVYSLSRLGSARGEEPQVDFSSAQEISLGATQLAQESVCIKGEKIVHDQYLVSEIHSADGISRVTESLVHSEEPESTLELSRPIANPESKTQTVTVDLTKDDSPTRENSELYEAPANPLCSGVDVHSEFRIPSPPNRIPLEELAFDSAPRHKRRSVTFASPIECVLDSEIDSRRGLSPSSITQSRQSPLIPASNPPSPLRIPRRTAGMRNGSPSRITPRVPLQGSKSSQASVSDDGPDDAGIQDIVEVLDEIHAVIIKGISDKFRTIRKGVQRSRDELVQQVLDELRGMVVENANYFNGLLRLEENYYKNCKGVVRCWEELIDCNHDIAAQLQHALKQHDQNTSVGVFPKSLLPMRPVFPRRRTNAC